MLVFPGSDKAHQILLPKKRKKAPIGGVDKQFIEAVHSGSQICTHRLDMGQVCRLQALGDRCRVCEKKLARSAATASGKTTRFWEGGQGCRDPKRMDRHDPHR